MKFGVGSESICISCPSEGCTAFSAMSGRTSSALRGDLLSFAEISSECPREKGVMDTWSVPVILSDFLGDTFSSVSERLCWGPVSKWSKVSMTPDDLRLTWESHSVEGVSVNAVGCERLPNRLSAWLVTPGLKSDFTVGMRTRGNWSVGELFEPFLVSWVFLSLMIFFMRESIKLRCLGLPTGDEIVWVTDFVWIWLLLYMCLWWGAEFREMSLRLILISNYWNSVS